MSKEMIYYETMKDAKYMRRNGDLIWYVPHLGYYITPGRNKKNESMKIGISPTQFVWVVALVLSYTMFVYGLIILFELQTVYDVIETGLGVFIALIIVAIVYGRGRE